MKLPHVKATTPKTPDIPVDEKLCTQCGKCCYKKLLIGRFVYITPFPCEFLDVKTNLCTIYDRRQELNPLCLSVPEGMTVSAFPTDCPYVPIHAPKNYKPAYEKDWSEEWDDFDAFADDLEASPEMRAIVHARGPHAKPMYADVPVPSLIDLARAPAAAEKPALESPDALEKNRVRRETRSL